MAYEVGDRIIVQTVFTNEAGTPTSPSALVGDVRSPSGVLTPLTPADQGSGVIRMTLPTFTEGGVWRWYVAGTAGVIAADQGTIRVDPKVTGT
jgi:hypothetical protein